MNIWLIVLPACFSIILSMSVNCFPSVWASCFPTRLLPVPMKPVRIMLFFGWVVVFCFSVFWSVLRIVSTGAFVFVHSSKAAVPWYRSIACPLMVLQPFAFASFKSFVCLGL